MQTKPVKTVCFGWLGLKTALYAIEKGAASATFTVVIEEEKDLLAFLPDYKVLPEIIHYNIAANTHQENWETNKAAVLGLAQRIGPEKLVLVADLESQENTFALIKFITAISPSILENSFLIYISPLLEDSLNWKRAIPYMDTVKAIPLNKQFVHLPNLIKEHQLGSMTMAKCEKYFCAYINNLIEEVID